MAPRVAFFTWTAALGKIVTEDNLRKRRLIVVEWCCMCKASGETPDQLLLHCEMAREVWFIMLCLFGVRWTTPLGPYQCWSFGVFIGSFW